jgi:hypothetical protein
MKRVKHYRVRLTEEDLLLKQKAQELGVSAADVIRLGIKGYIGNLESSWKRDLKSHSQFIKNWEQNFGQSIIREFREKWQNTLQTAYLLTLTKYKGSVYYVDGNFEVISNVIEVEETSDAPTVVEEIQPKVLPEQKVKQDICLCLTKILGGGMEGR